MLRRDNGFIFAEHKPLECPIGPPASRQDEGGVRAVDPKISLQLQGLYHLKIAAAEVEHAFGPLRSLPAKQIALVHEVFASGADARTALTELRIAQVPEESVLEATSYLAVRLGYRGSFDGSQLSRRFEQSKHV